MNINAGSDTIASTLRAIFYHLLKNPDSLQELEEELESALAQGEISRLSPTWTETQQNLPYLCAVIKEGLRMNPALSLPLERVVPTEGLNLQHEDGTQTFLAGGTVVGINPGSSTALLTFSDQMPKAGIHHVGWTRRKRRPRTWSTIFSPLGRGKGPVWAKTSPCWSCISWFLPFF